MNVFRLPKGHENHRRLFLGPRCESLVATHHVKSQFFVKKVDFHHFDINFPRVNVPASLSYSTFFQDQILRFLDKIATFGIVCTRSEIVW